MRRRRRSRPNTVAVQANELALEGTRAEQSVGTRTVIEVLNAEQELLNSQVALVTAKRDAYVAGFQLLNAMGQAEAQDLGLDGGPLYDPLGNYRRVANNWNDWASDPRHPTIATRTVSPGGAAAEPGRPRPRIDTLPRHRRRRDAGGHVRGDFSRRNKRYRAHAIARPRTLDGRHPRVDQESDRRGEGAAHGAAARSRPSRTNRFPKMAPGDEDVLELDRAARAGDRSRPPAGRRRGCRAEPPALEQLQTVAASVPAAPPVNPLEEMVRGMLRPILKQWLDEHLPQIVEEHVKREISRITGPAALIFARLAARLCYACGMTQHQLLLAAAAAALAVSPAARPSDDGDRHALDASSRRARSLARRALGGVHHLRYRFDKNKRNNTLYRLDLTRPGAAPQPIAGAEKAHDAVFGPRRILWFLMAVGDQDQLFRMPLGGAPVQVSNFTGDVGGFKLAPIGQRGRRLGRSRSALHRPQLRRASRPSRRRAARPRPTTSCSSATGTPGRRRA